MLTAADKDMMMTVFIALMGKWLIPTVLNMAILYLQHKHIQISKTVLANILQASGNAVAASEVPAGTPVVVAPAVQTALTEEKKL